MTLPHPDVVDDVDASALVIEAEMATEIVNRARAMVQRRIAQLTADSDAAEAGRLRPRPGPTAPAAHRRPPCWAAVRQPPAGSGPGPHTLPRQRIGQLSKTRPVPPRSPSVSIPTCCGTR